MASGVFVSYRKSDDPGWAGRVRDSLASHFGDERVFFDVDSIRGGQRWEEALDEALGRSGTLVLVIGPRWLECLRERQSSPDTDHHLREITTALDKGISVYPVRVHSAPMPELEDLPEELRTRLPAIQWMEIYDNLFGPSMQRVIADIERTVGPGDASHGAPAAPRGGVASATVGPWGSDADFHEIADAVGAVVEGGTIRVRPGRYLKQIVLDRPVAIVGEGKGEVLLDSDAVPCVLARTTGVIRGLNVRSSAPAGAVGIRVEGGDLSLEDVQVRAEWVAGSTGIEATGVGTQAMLGGCEVRSVAVGIRVGSGASPRIERTSVSGATDHALVVSGGGDPNISACSFAGTEGSTLLFTEDGRGTVDDSAIGDGGGVTVEVTGGADPTFRGARGAMPSTTALTAIPDRFVKRAVDRPAPEDPDRTGWTVVVADGGRGRFSRVEVAEVRTASGGDPAFTDSSITVVRSTDEGQGSFEHCDVGSVVLASGADPVFRSNCTISPDRGIKVTVDVGSGAAGTFEDCEIVGRNVRDGSADPAVRSDGGRVTLRRTTVRNPGEGALWASGGGSITMAGGDVRCSVGGPAIVVADGSVVLTVGATARGARVEPTGRLALDAAALEADAVTGAVLAVADGGSFVAEGSQIRGPGRGAARKVGRWIESRSDRVRAKTGGILGSIPVLDLAEGSVNEFRRCALEDLGGDALVVPAEGTRFEGCTLDGEPFP